MKLAVKSVNSELINLIENRTGFNEVIAIENFEEVKSLKKVSHLLCEGSEMENSDLLTLGQESHELNIMIYNEGMSSSFEKACITNGVIPVDTKNENEIVNFIQNKWEHKKLDHKYENVVAISGTHARSGVTQTSLGLAYELSETFQKKVIVLGLSPYSSGELANTNIEISFGELYDRFYSSIEDDATLFEQLGKVDGFHYIPSNRDLYKAAEFERGPIVNMVNYLKERCDLLILDCGSFYDSFLPITGLELAENHILVATQEHEAIEQYKAWNDQIFKRVGLDFEHTNRSLIVNKFVDQSLITVSQLESELECSFLRAIPFFPEANDQVLETDILVKGAEKKYNAAFEGIARGFTNEEGIKKKKSIFGFLKRDQ